MKTPSSFRCSLPALFIAGALLGAPHAYAEEPNLSEFLTKHAALLEDLGKAVAAAGQGGNNDAPAASDAGSPQTQGLQTGGLKTSGLQTSGLSGATGISALGLGLTPAERWRALFPQKKQ